MQDGVLSGNPTFLSPPLISSSVLWLAWVMALLCLCTGHQVQLSSVSTCRWSLAALEGDRRVPVLVYRMRLVKGCVDRAAAMAGTPSAPVALVSSELLGHF